MITDAQKQDLRHAVLGYLARRPTFAFDQFAIARYLTAHRHLDFRVSDADVVDACTLLLSLNLIQSSNDPLGASRYYQATGAGVLQDERRRRDLGIPEGA